MSLHFTWDSNKARSNAFQHGVGFQEAVPVFRDELAAIFEDAWHSDDEDREIIVGHSQQNRLLVVIFMQRSESIRIISARKATRRESEAHEKKRTR